MAKYDLEFDPPLLNSAGSLGFAPDFRGLNQLPQLGAFVTNPISKRFQSPASGTRLIEYPGGFLLHTGYPNPGFRATLREHSDRWANSPVPVLVHLLFEGIHDTQRMIDTLEGNPGVAGIEIGLVPDIGEKQLTEIGEAIISELPIILRLPHEKIDLLSASSAESLFSKIAAVSLSPPRGMLLDPNGDPVSGRLYGPALYPQTLAAARRLSASGLRFIIGGGVYQRSQVDELLDAGASAVQLDAVLWRGGYTPN